MQPARDDRIHHEAVIGVVRADGVKAQPGALGIFVQARLATVIGTVQGLEADQGARGFPYRRGLRGRDTGQPGLTQAAQLPHAQTQRGVAGQGNRRMPQAHVARDREPRHRLAQARRIKAVLVEQRQGVMTAAAHRIRQLLHETDRQIPQTHR